METLLSQFHLLRPYWLLALIPAFVLFITLLKRRLASSRWNGIIDPDLMPHVLDQMPSEQTRWPIWFVLMAWILAVIALSGPTWEKLPHPIQKKQDSLVIVLDMSLSMAAQDINPDRATRAKQKIIDILQQRPEGLTAMVVYAGDAYTVTPLTDDADTIINLVPALSPFIMPAMGSRPDKALTLAKKLVTDAGLRTADFLLITDGIQNKDIKRITEALGENSSDLSILTIGTEEGAPISIPKQGFLRDKQGNIVLPKLELDPIKQLSSKLNIRWHQMSFDDTDWQYLLHQSPLDQSRASKESAASNAFNMNDKNDAREREFDLWSDQGYWLIPFLIFVAAFSFRRGWMLSIVLLISLQPDTSYADVLDDLWQTKDQQAQKLFAEDPTKAAELFENSKWKASSYYKAGDYEEAASHYEIDDNDSIENQAEAHYNKGNALAKSGALEDAFASYNKALELNEELSDASFNKDLVEKLLEQQKQEQDQQDQDSDNGESEDSDSDQDASNQDSSNQDSSDQDDSKQENSKQESSDQDGSDQDSSDQKSSESNDSQTDDSSQESSEQQSQQESEQEQDQEQDQENSEETDQAESEQQKSEDSSQDSTNEEPTEANNSINETESDLSREERQALDQWLNKIPDDPGGLLKRKFLYQYQQRENQQRTQQDEGEVSW